MARSAVRTQDERLELGDLVAKAKAGDERVREQILQEYRPFFSAGSLQCLPEILGARPR